jgi:hypothetical protein
VEPGRTRPIRSDLEASLPTFRVMWRTYLPSRTALRRFYIWSSLVLAVGIAVLTAASFAGATLGVGARVPIGGGSRIGMGYVRCCRGGAMVVVMWTYGSGPWHLNFFRNPRQDFYPKVDAQHRYFALRVRAETATGSIQILLPTFVPLVLLIAPPGLLLYRDHSRRRRAVRGLLRAVRV